jgi:CubicO group peptidase (beta-lactamase class C family)
MTRLLAAMCFVLGVTIPGAASGAGYSSGAPDPSAAGMLSACDKNRLARLEKQLDELRDMLKIPGMSAVIVRNQEVLWAKGFGYADLENRIPATPTTPYHIASLTKTFAATLLLRLVEQGKLSLEEPISKYADNVKDANVKIKHLLSHTSEGVPGDRYRYSGDRYDLLTAVFPALCGKSFREVLVETILDPLEMSDSVPGQDVVKNPKWAERFGKEKLHRYGQVLARLAQPYRLYGTEIIHTPYPPQGIGAAAGLISTVLDLAKYDAAVDRHVFVNTATQERAWTPFRSNAGKPLPHGLGWFAETFRGKKLIWHFGDWPCSFSALLLKVPEQNLSFYLLANSDALSEPPFYNAAGVEGSPFATTFLKLFVFEEPAGHAFPDPKWAQDSEHFRAEIVRFGTQEKEYPCSSELLAHQAIMRWLEESRANARKAVKLPAQAYEAYVGRYGGKPTGEGGFLIKRAGDRLIVLVPGIGDLEMFPESPTKFFLKGMDLSFTFFRNDTGEVVALEFQTRGQKQRVKKRPTQPGR